MNQLYHVVSAASWAAQSQHSLYEAASLQTEGFIHLSEKEQIAGVLERYYRGVPDLLLLHIDPSTLTAELRYEAATNNEPFPHLYGPLNRSAIIKVEAIEDRQSME